MLPGERGADDATATGAHGLEWRDGKLYVASPPSQMIHVMDPDAWQELYHFRAPGLRCARPGLVR